jgi:hypothetical protein
VVIEHNLDVIKVSDRLIDLGPEGGDEGGQVIATGTPEEVASEPASYTGRFLAPLLEVKAKRGRKPAARGARSANGSGAAKTANGSAGAKTANGSGGAKTANGSGGAKAANGSGAAKTADGSGTAKRPANGAKGKGAGGSGNGSSTRRRTSAGKR